MTPPNSSNIRRAGPADAAAVAACVRAAYRHYVPRIGKQPGPMLVDYADAVARHQVWLIPHGKDCAAALVLVPETDYLQLDNIAVDPRHQGRGLGRALLALAETEAARQGYAELRLYTHARMTENIAMYARLGWQETGRGAQDGYDRVFFRKRVPRNDPSGA